jgi:hypothetical protein
MKTFKTIVAICLALMLGSCTKNFDFPANQTEIFELQATSTGHTFNIMVGLPENYDATQAEAYPVIYLLDADWDFERVAIYAKEQRPENQSPAIVVGIGYPDSDNQRNRDYTPTQSRWEEAGGAEDYIHFIQNDLIPTIESKYNVRKTADQRLIIGHSLGGLLGAYLFVAHNDLFHNYLILSPSLWWDNQVFFEMEANRRSQNQENEHNIYLGIGEMESFGMNPVFDLFSERLSENYPQVTLQTWRVKGKGHNDSKPENLRKGLQFFFQNL